MSKPMELKIENWGNFFIQRLYHLAKSDAYCDYTIHSALNDSFKVHRVVLNACSDYFCSRPNTDTSITIPAHLDFNAVKSVIMFMYTGKLNYTEESHMSLLEAANTLSMTAVLKLLKLQGGVNESISNNCSPLVSTSSVFSEPLNQCGPANKSVGSKLSRRLLPTLATSSTFKKSMKVKDVLTEKKPMRFECNADVLPEFIENTFEQPKYDSAPLLKLENIECIKAMLKRTSDGKLINKNHETPLIKCDTQIILPTDRKLKKIRDIEQKNVKSKLVQDVLVKVPHLLPSENNVELKMANNDQSQFENIIKNTPNSIGKLSSVGNVIKKPLTIYKEKPDILNIKGPWSCNLCGTDANPLPLESYFAFRRHIVEEHNEREDSRVCVYCGHIYFRENYQILHKLIKHNIQPPAGFKVHKCNLCDFVAYNDHQLKKHQTMFCRPQSPKLFFYRFCGICSRMFKTFEQLSEHLSNFHKISEQETKKLLLCAMNNIHVDNKVFLENKSLYKIEEVTVHNEDYFKPTEYQKDQINLSEEATEIETVTLEDALQVFNENVA